MKPTNYEILDRHHNYFILYEENSKIEYTKMIEILEKTINNNYPETCFYLPVVYLFSGGDDNMITTVKKCAELPRTICVFIKVYSFA